LHDCHSLRKRVPEPFAEINPEAAKEYDIRDGDMITVSTRRGSINIEARVTEDIIPRVVNVPHGWAQVNCKNLTMARPADPITGIPTYKALLCKITKKG
jgi:anaerobic selenocysteine-containing dehydrogenase